MESVVAAEEKTKQDRTHKRIKYALAAVCLLVSLGFVVGILYSVIDYYVTPRSWKEPELSTTFPATKTTTALPTTMTTSALSSTKATSAETTPPSDGMESIYNITGGGMFDHFPNKNHDGLNIKFSHGTNSYRDMDDAIAANKDAIEGDITLQHYQTPSQTEIPIMAHPPAMTSDYTLDQWLDVLTDTDKAIKLDIKINEVIPYALQSLKSHAMKLHQPVWINADLLKGPNSNEEPINKTTFLMEVNKKYPYVTLSLGWTTSYWSSRPSEKYSWESMDEMLEIVRNLEQRITFPARAALVRESWDRFLWLLEQSNRYSLTIWSSQTDRASTEDMVFVRDNFDVSRIFYDVEDYLTDPLMAAINSSTYPKVFYTGGNVLDCLRIPNREAINVTWMHRTNTIDLLQSALNDSTILMLEADVRLYGEGTAQVNSSLPVMSHDPPALDYDYTLEEWLKQILVSNETKGLKLDFKSLGALKASLTILAKMKKDLTVPIWLNSDILKGPNSITQPVNATEFFRLTQELFPESTLSPGWTTAYRHVSENGIYTQEMVEEMYSYCSTVRAAITFPVRASLTRSSIPSLQWLLSKSNRYSLTVWHSTSEPITTEELLEIYNSFEPDKVYFDLPRDIMDDLLNAIANQTS